MGNTPTESTDVKGTRKRSQNFPFIDLEAAVERTRAVWTKAQSSWIGTPTLAGIWDYSVKSSGFQKTIAAVIAYGLMEDEGAGEKRKFKVSRAGERIVDNAPDAKKLLGDAALKPKLFLDVLQYYKGRLPDDDVLRNELRFGEEFTFNKDSIGVFIENLKATIDFAKLDQPAIMQSGGGENDVRDGVIKPPDASKGNQVGQQLPPPAKGNMKNFAFPMGSGDVVTITAPHPMTEDDFNMLLAIMQAAKRGFLAPKKQVDDPLDDTPSR